MKLFALYLLSILSVAFCAGRLQKWQTVYQRLGQEKDLSEFYALVQSSRLAKINLFYREVTVFAPTNEAIDNYAGKLNNETLLFHMVYGVKHLHELTYGSMKSVQEEYPPLWVTKRDDNTYVNNALVIKEKSNHFSKNRLDDNGKNQVSHYFHSEYLAYLENSCR